MEGRARQTVELYVSLHLSVALTVTVIFFKQNHGLLPEENQGHPKPQELQDTFKCCFYSVISKERLWPLTEGMCQLKVVSPL